MQLRAPHQGRGPGGGRSAGTVRAADRRGHHLPLRRAVPVQAADRAGAGRTVRRPAVGGYGRGDHRPGRRAAGRLPGAGTGGDRRQCRGRVRRDRVPRGGEAALGARCPHRQYTLLMVHARRGVKAMEAMGVLASFAGVAVHDAWAPYDTYTAPEHQLCCAHALRELQAAVDCSPEGEWCWAAQAAEAITGMQQLASEAVSQGRAAADPAALAAWTRTYRSAALIGVSQT